MPNNINTDIDVDLHPTDNKDEDKAENKERQDSLRRQFAKDEQELSWKLLDTEHLVQDEWIDFRRVKYEFPDGSVFEPFYNYSRRDYVVIVASDEEGNYLCVRQFRQGIEEVTTEFPAGGIERGGEKDYRTDGEAIAATGAALSSSTESGIIETNEITPHQKNSGTEDALTAAKRELLEETGYVSDEWTHLLTVPSAATIADNYAYIFRARNCRKVTGQHLDETEFLRHITLTSHEIETLIANGQFQQSIHVLAWLLAQRADLK